MSEADAHGTDTVPCAYCQRPTPPERQACAPWHWPRRGMVTNCLDCHHTARPDDSPAPGDRCKECGRPVTWIGPTHLDWQHADG